MVELPKYEGLLSQKTRHSGSLSFVSGVLVWDSVRRGVTNGRRLQKPAIPGIKLAPYGPCIDGPFPLSIPPEAPVDSENRKEDGAALRGSCESSRQTTPGS